MTADISQVLANWEYVPNQVAARLIGGRDGRPKIQMRLELGLIQMELDGQPDGCRPHDCESLLAHYRSLALTEPGFVVDADIAAQLQHEGILYYYRYLCLLHLGDYDRAARDTARNLELFDFVRVWADDDVDVWLFEQYRPYVTMMNARAQAMTHLETGDQHQALQVIESAISQLDAFCEENDFAPDADDCAELRFLREWAEEIRGFDHRPGPAVETAEQRLERELEEAVHAERYEQAAFLRDQLRRIRGE